MARPYETAIEHLDDVAGWVVHLFDRLASAVDRRRSLDDALAARIGRIEDRLAAGRSAGAPLPWDRLRGALRLSPREQAVLQVVVAVEVVPALRQRMREHAGDPGRIWPDVGLLVELLYGRADARAGMLDELAGDGVLFQTRLLDVVGSARQVEDAPFLLRPLKVAARVLDVFHGAWRLDREVTRVAELIEPRVAAEPLLLPDAVQTEVRDLLRAAEVGGGGAPVVILSGREGAGRKSLVLRAAAALDRSVLRIRCADLPVDARDLTRTAQALLREARLFGAIPLLDGIEHLAADDAGRVDRVRGLDAVLEGYRGAVFAVGPASDGRHAQFARGVVVIDVPMPTEAARAELWRRALGAGATDALCVHAAERYPLTGGLIARSAAAARARSHARHQAITTDDVHAGVRATLDSKIGTLGTRVEWRQSWDDLVLPAETVDEIREMIARVRHRRRVHDEWGFAAKVGRGLGLSALFAGPPGTGKTMVAGLIAEALGLDLYQIDLSRIVSKWIGETEKNLAQVFDAAEAGHAILLFDEADSLFSKRTEVKSSVDRYANLEVNYLLQRMEAFSGITILTTNLDAAIDEAFRRRLAVRIQFPMPEADERLRLWRALLPAQAAVAPDIDFAVLADRYAMSGGYIRNAVVRAAFLAAADGSPITMRLLVRAAALEYAAMGKVMHSGLA